MNKNNDQDFQALADHLPDIVAKFDNEGRCFFVNPQIEKEFGIPQNKLIGSTLNELNLSQDFIEQFENNLIEVINSGVLKSFEFTYNSPTGTSYYNSKLIPQLNDQNIVSSVLAIISNITDKKKAKEKSNLEEQKQVNIKLRTEIAELKKSEEIARLGEENVRLKLEHILSPEGKLGKLELQDILDVNELQSLMENFYKLTHITVAIIDTAGKVLVGVGWQNICTKFHRVHPDTSKNCLESDTQLTTGIPEGEFKTYKCKNGLWDLATPIIIGGEHMGNLFMGQFFYDNEVVDYDFFRLQAKQFGFDEKAYITALENVPRLNRKDLDNAKAFFTKLAHSISQLSYTNIKLARLLNEHNILIDSLSQSEERFRNMFQKPKAIMLLIDPISGAIIDANMAAVEFYGWSGEKLCSMKIQDINTLSEEEVSKERLAALTEHRNHFVFPHRLANNQIRWVEVYSSPILIQDKQMLFSVIHDITERKTFEDNLRKSEENIRAILNATKESILMLDREGIIITANITAANRLNRSLEDIIGHPFSEFVPSEIISTRNSNISEVFNSGKPLQFEDERNGIIFNHSLYPVFENNSVSLVVTYSQDITERKKAEEALLNSERLFRLALKNAPVSVAVQDLDLRFTFAYNQRTVKAADVYGKTDNDLFPPEDAARLIALKRRVIETGDVIREKLWITSNGKRVYIDLFLEPLQDESGKITGIGIATIDLTQMKLAEQKIEHLASFPKLNPNPVIETDLDGKITYYNDATLVTLKKLDSEEDVSLFLPADLDEIINSIKEPDEIQTFFREVDIKGRVFIENINLSKGLNFIRIYTQDITERKSAEEQIRKLWSAVEQSPDSIVITDNKGKIEYVNPKFTNITGYSFSEAIGKNPRILKSGQNNREVYKALWENITSGKEFRGALVNKKKSGELYWESINISPVKNPKGEITNFVAVKEDITERKKAEEKLYRLNRTLNALRHSSEIILHSSDESSYMQDVCKIIVNDCGHKMIWIGFAEEDENKTVLPVASAGFEEGYLQTLNITWADTERGRGPTGTAIRTGIPSICNNMLIDPRFRPWRAEAIKRGYASSVVLPLVDGKKIFGAMSIYSSEPDSFSQEEVDLLSELANDLAYGTIVIRLRSAHALAMEELTKHRDHLEDLIQKRTVELENANEILEEAQTVAHIGNWFLDFKKNHLQWSKEVYNIFGLETDSFDGTLEAFLNLVHPDDVKFVEDSFGSSVEDKTFYSIDHRIVRPDGEFRIVHEQCITHYDKDGSPLNSVGIVQDITEIKQVEREIELHRSHLEDLVNTRTGQLDKVNQQLKDEIEKEKQVELLLKDSLEKERELNELKSRFISTTSHEFRTPLTSILSSMQLVQRYRKKWSDEKIEDQFDRVKTSIFNLTKLLDDILTISRADSGRIIFNPKILDLYRFSLEVIEEVKHKANGKHKFIFNFLSARKEFLLDPRLIHFVIINLLSNAFKYSPDGGEVTLIVSSTKKVIQITVSDEGIGIPTKDREHLFKPFYRAKNTGEIEGTGLGLSIVQRAVELHKGVIKCYSKLGAGTRFVVKIPMEQQ